MDETNVTEAIVETVGETVAASDGLVDDELLVEEISIDGMCGVY